MIAAAAAGGCGAATAPPVSTGTLTIAGPHGVLLRLSVQLATTPQARATGLMHATHLADTAGMVFEFPAITSTAFWMKDTVIPLDIAFWNAAGTIIDVNTMQPCAQDPCPLYVAGAAYAASVEVAGGLLERAGVQPGDHVSLTTPPGANRPT